jgi:hypothetical protein
MDVSPDELAGVADLFGGLTREEFEEAIENVAARQGAAFEAAALGERIEAARQEHYLLGVDHGGSTVFVPGPTALPTLPEHAEDLPHMMDVSERDIDVDRLAGVARERLERDAEAAVDAGDSERVRFLLDACYDAEAWGPVDVAPVRERLLAMLDAE